MPEGWNWGLKGRPSLGVKGFPKGNTTYGKGFKDGCSNGFSSVATGLVSAAAPKNIDPIKMTDKKSNYLAGWWDGFEQCVYIYDWDVL